MVIKIHQTILNILTEDRELENSSRAETYILYPDNGKILKYLPTGTFAAYAEINNKKDIEKYIEVDIEEN